MYIVDPSGKLIYSGAIDSKPTANPDDIASSTNYVKAALEEAMAGKPVTTPNSRAFSRSTRRSVTTGLVEAAVAQWVWLKDIDERRGGGTVHGVAYQRDGQTREVEALVTVGADGRFSRLRKLAGLEPVRTAPPMDVVWLRLPRHDGDAHDFSFMVGNGRLCVLLERETEWQAGFVIPKGGYQRLRGAGITALQQELAAVVPWLADRVHLLRDWQDVTLLVVESSRLRRWYVPGLLLIGDAAHVMSPVFGVGINYAVQDAVAASNLLLDPLRAGGVEPHHLRAVQARREWPTRVIQFIQGRAQKRAVERGVCGRWWHGSTTTARAIKWPSRCGQPPLGQRFRIWVRLASPDRTRNPAPMVNVPTHFGSLK
jgi:2-polyprenyl-6-methoxyphenol hydroxylase-like FAD-dependent oxidoreductase